MLYSRFFDDNIQRRTHLIFNALLLPVDGTSWTNAFTKLQYALSAASSGDQIWVAAFSHTDQLHPLGQQYWPDF
jgi:hypothetical protein